MSDDLTYNINNIFDVASPKGVLRRYEAKKYYIAPYQRGYKWASSEPNDAVCLLISDLFDAERNSLNEYYLQFITTKSSKTNDGEFVLEVIDGQQRLTTLTILLSVLGHIIGDEEKTISNNLLLYEVRQKVTVFFQKYIYKNIGMLMTDDWDGYIKKYPENDEQDIYYLYSAANKINKMLVEKFSKDIEAVKKFRTYLLDNVRIILNHIENNIYCEEIFSNLNDNKVELTSSELIKGLILTNVARETPNTDKIIKYKEKMELWAGMGRQWDEISHWANREEIKKFYFSNSGNVLDELLFLLALDDKEFDKTTDKSKKNAVFNHFQLQVKNKSKTTKKIFDTLKEIKSVLNEWFNDKEFYNSLGYVLFSRKSPKKTIKDYISFFRKEKPELDKELKQSINNILDFDIDELRYPNNNSEIFDLLLALNVFRDGERFDFTAFSSQKIWSIEHIFPQTPDELENELSEKDISTLKSLCDNNLGDFEKIKDKLREHEEIMDIKNVYNSLSGKMNKKSCVLDSNEKKVLYCLIKIEKLQSVGNMALLTGPDNSSNGNGMFDKKRNNIVRRISQGSFVPKHTYDVFSKLFSKDITYDLTIWTPNDIDAHLKEIEIKINKIKSAGNYEPR